MNRLKYFFYVLIGLSICFTSCKSNPNKASDKQQKVLKKQEEEKEKAKQKAIERGKERHLNIQSKDTRKRMKSNRKKYKSGGQPAPKKKFFILRWFS
ncbi:MAG: hypothetical protein HS119_11005 [Flavobacteriales bacterium]|nr:hypothetical protein [Flavobacteriales bacterium]